LLRHPRITAIHGAQDGGIAALAAKLGHQLAGTQIRSVVVLQFTNKQNYDPYLSTHPVDQINQEMVKPAGHPGRQPDAD
jgi:hypothetical protein